MSNDAHHVVEVFKNAGQFSPSSPTMQVWKTVLEIKDASSFYRDIGAFSDLVAKVTSELFDIHDDKEGIEIWSGKLLRALAPEHMMIEWSRFRNTFDAQTISLLRGHAKILSMHAKRVGFTPELAKQADELLDEALRLVLATELDLDVKELVASRIEQLIAILRRYKYSSPDAVMDKAKLLAAELSVLPQDARTELESSGVFEKVKSGIEIVANATQSAVNVQALLPVLSHAANLLPK